MSFEEEFDDILRQKSEELNYPVDAENWDKAAAMLDAERTQAFDNIIRQKNEEVDYAFDKTNWKKMSALLDADQGIVTTSGFKKYALAAVLAGIAILSGIAILLNTSQPDKKTTTTTLADNTVPSANSAKAAEHQPERATAAVPATSQPLTQDAPDASATTAAPNNAVTDNPSSSQPESSRSTKTNNTARLTSGTAAQTKAPANISSPVASFETTKRTSSTSQANTPAGIAALPAASKAGQATAHQADAEQPVDAGAATASSGSDASIKTPAQQNPATGNTAGTQSENNNPATQNTNTQQGFNAAFPAQLLSDPQEASSASFEQLPLLMAHASEQPEPEIVTIPFNHIDRYDDDYYKNNRKTCFFNMELGGTYLLGWHTDAGLDGKGLDWFGGVNYGVYLGRKMNVSLGLQSYNIRNITQASYTAQKVEYDFGAVTSRTVITSNNLLYVAMPLKFSYELNKTSSFGLGANFGYLVSSSNTIETYQVGNDNITTHSNPVKNTGVYQNANSMNVMLSASYKVEVMKRLHLNTEIVYGLSDIFKDTKLNKNKEQPMGLRLSLQYTLFDK